MILHRLLWRFARHRDDAVFYALQATDAIRWIGAQGVRLGPGVRVLDLGCGHGVFGGELARRGCDVAFADERNDLLPEHRGRPFHVINLDRDDVATLGRHDLVVCSNVLEHLSRPREFLQRADQLLAPGGRLYLSWTNWLSPWGGHEFSPFHYLGARLGTGLHDALVRARFHKPGVNLFVTHIGRVMGWIRRDARLGVVAMAPRYYTELGWLMHCPGLREFAAWNAALLLQARTSSSPKA